MLTKKEFIEIINRLKDTDETIDKINELLRNSRDVAETEFTSGASILVCHKDIVVTMLDKMFESGDDISWWIYDQEYGTKFKIGNLSYAKDGKIIEPDLSSAEKLYDYLIESLQQREKSN